MIGKIIGVEENLVIVELTLDLNKYKNLINRYVFFEEKQIKIVGEIAYIKDSFAYINLLGEIVNEKFTFGVINKPAFSAKVKLVSAEEARKIISIENYEEDKHLYVGKSPLYENADINISINDFFSSHFAIFGSTGSGKSCGVSRLIQNLFSKTKSIPYKATIVIFDAYGEYHSAFNRLSEKVPEISFKAYTTNTVFEDTDVVKIPLWLLTADDIALLLGAEKHSQLPIIEKAIKLVNIFSKEEEEVVKYKNDIIARAILDILSSGKPPAQIRDQIFSVLSHYHTKELNLDTPVFQPGYTRPLKQCLLIDASGKIREMELITGIMEKYISDDLVLPNLQGQVKYNLNDLQDAFEFALISEGVLKSEKIYDDANILRVRLRSLVNSDSSVYFDYPEYIDKAQYIRNLMLAPNGKKAQIINFNINYVDDRLAKTITKIFSKMFFDYSKDTSKRNVLPFHIILEEAHRYVQNDNDINLLGYNIFDRITKEGRKYGVLLGLISQRPSELSSTSLSQCSNFMIYKMLHPTDVEYIREMVPNITDDIVKKLRILQPGNCIAFGSAFKVPVLIKMEMPDPAPTSSSCDITNTWFVTKN